MKGGGSWAGVYAGPALSRFPSSKPLIPVIVPGGMMPALAPREIPKLHVRGRRGAYFIRGFPGPDVTESGPYPTIRDANEKLRGLLRTYKFGHLRSFWTCEKLPREGATARRNTNATR